MAEETRQNCKFSLLRYVPNAVKGEFVNIGLVLVPPHSAPELRFSKDWSRVTSLDPQADTAWLDAFRDELDREPDKLSALRQIIDSFSNTLQASDYKACLTAAPAQEADELAQIYLNSPRPQPRREKGPRQRILQDMEKAFFEAGVWSLMRKNIAASEYSRSGDPLRIDCGYQAQSSVRMFQATSLKTDVTASKVLAFSYPEIAAGILQKEGAKADLTAIIEDDLERNEQIEFALETMKRAGIRIAAVTGLPDLAARAAKELGL
jgi:hypothetical protein